ncbi:MAG: hypothetical protein FWE37_07205 [Spirochaetaceae bacterium]|nr:hypothetical protein [Spirochaetaceae bacterium]
MRLGLGFILFISKLDTDDNGKAITAAGGKLKAVNHCGIYAGGDTIIDATPEAGVSLRPLPTFIHNVTQLIIAEIADQNVAVRSFTRAQDFLGRPYNYTFLSGAQHNHCYGLYCSQLITESFLNEDGGRFFKLATLNFSSDKLDYWQSYYKKYNMAIPYHEEGSHPQQLLEQTAKFKELQYISPIINKKGEVQ